MVDRTTSGAPPPWPGDQRAQQGASVGLERPGSSPSPAAVRPGPGRLTTTGSYRQSLSDLRGAQKSAARSAPAYSRFVNRRLGRYLAAWAHQRGMTPNGVTALSAAFTFSGIAALALAPPTWALGVVVAACLVLGYALDSADGQLARLTGSGGPAGEWLDHVVDATKISAMPLALAVGFYRFDVGPRWWLLVPLVNAVVNSALFFAEILTEKLRSRYGVVSRASAGGRVPWLRSVLVVPVDYGLLCLSFLLLGAPAAFGAVYAALTLATVVFAALAFVKWFREMQQLPSLAGTPEVSHREGLAS